MDNNTTTTNTATTSTSSYANTLHAAAASMVPIKVFPTSASIREFDGENPQYKACQFLGLCEDVMRGSSVTSDEDKIAFIRSRLAGEALHMMNTSVLCPYGLGMNYAKFKKNFLRVFEGDQSDLIMLTSRTIENLPEAISNQTVRQALIQAHRHATEVVTCLKNSDWIQRGKVSKELVKNYLEFF